MREILKAAALIGQLGLTVVAAILISLAIGWLIDRWLGTRFFRIIFLLLGVGAGYWSAAKQLRIFFKRRS
ncbi:TPA: AtpZ/AtpI family protein [Candidatus Bipolaricaulota bacterium]|nr:AtpZ/AtpI family protein [Candidatus Bipolaricaulota bacterium]